MADHLIIFDTTLRDGEQSPGASMTKEEKMRIAKQLERLRVDVIEAGFPGIVERRLGGGPRDRGRDQGQHGVRARARQRERHRTLRRGDQAGEIGARPHVHRDLADPHADEAADDAGRRCSRRR